MTRNTHDEVRELIALGEGLSDNQQAWLRAHLDECQACRNYAEAANGVVRSLRSFPLAADSRLVRATQMQVRHRAMELQRQQERLWVMCVCCVAVTLGTALTTAVLWGGLAWMGQHARLSGPLWPIGVVALGLMPAVVTGIVLLARGTYLADPNESPQD